MITETTKPFVHPGMSKKGTMPLCSWPKAWRSAKHHERFTPSGPVQGGAKMPKAGRS